MIQVKVVESILSNLTWSIVSPNEVSKKVDSFIPRRKNSDLTNLIKKDVLQFVDTKNDIDQIDLDLNSKVIINLSNSKENIPPRKFLFQNFVKKERTPFEVSRIKIVKTTNYEKCSKSPEELTSKKIIPLAIDRLKNDFQRADNFVPRIRIQKNWKPLFLNLFSEIKTADEDPVKEIQKIISTCGPEKPNVYSIGLKYKLNPAYEKSSSFLKKEEFKRKTFQNQDKSSFPVNSARKSGFNSRSEKNAIISLNTKSSKNRLIPLHQIEGVIKIGAKSRKRTRDKKIRTSSWQNVSDKSDLDRKNPDFNFRKDRNSDEDNWKNSLRKHRSVRKENTSEKLEIIMPTKNFNQESIIFCEDTLTEKLNQRFLRDETMKKENLNLKDYDSSRFFSTELRKLDMMRDFEEIVDDKNSRNKVESEILKNIKTRIDDDFETDFCGEEKSLNDPSRDLHLKKVKKLIEIPSSEITEDMRESISRKNLIESVDSGVLTDFSVNDQRDEMCFRSRDDYFQIGDNFSLKEAKLIKPFPSFDSDSENSWSGEEGLSRKIEKAVKRFTDELILCERRIKARIKSKNMLIEDRDERVSNCRRRRKLKKKRSKSSFVNRHRTSSKDFPKSSLLTSEEDFDLNISSPLSFTDSEYEKSSK